VDVAKLSSRQLLDTYQEHSIDFKFEEALREGEIKKFAQQVTPKAKFIFDNYKVQTDLFSGKSEESAADPFIQANKESI
jgi:hypothetical protein